MPSRYCHVQFFLTVGGVYLGNAVGGTARRLRANEKTGFTAKTGHKLETLRVT
jgi:hypothetical protein